MKISSLQKRNLLIVISVMTAFSILLIACGTAMLLKPSQPIDTLNVNSVSGSDNANSSNNDENLYDDDVSSDLSSGDSVSTSSQSGSKTNSSANKPGSTSSSATKPTTKPERPIPQTGYTDKDGFRVQNLSKTYSSYAVKVGPEELLDPVWMLHNYLPSESKKDMEPLKSIGFNLDDWGISGNVSKDGNSFVIDNDGSAMYKKLDTSKTGKSYSIEMAFTTEDKQASNYGFYFDRGSGTKGFVIRVDNNSGMTWLNTRAGVNCARIAWQVGDTREGVRLRIDVHPSQNRIIYYANGRVYGERFLNNAADPDITGGQVGFFIQGCKAYITHLAVQEIDLPSRNWYYEAPDESRNNGDKLLPISNKPANTIYCVSTKGLTNDELLMLASLQGLVNRGTPQIYVDYGNYGGAGGNSTTKWYKLLEEKGRKLDWSKSVYDLLVMFKNSYDGVILGEAYKTGNVGYVPNVVTTLCGVKNSVYMTPEIYNKMSASTGKKVSIDVRNRWKNSISAYKWVFDNFWDDCSRDMIAHCTSDALSSHSSFAMRDYMVQNSVFCFAMTDVVTLEDYYFYVDLMAANPANTPVLGICQRNGEAPLYGLMDEDAIFRVSSDVGKYFTYTFSNDNISIMSGLEISGPLKQKAAPKMTYDSKKIYNSFVLSEGENGSWWYQLWRGSYMNCDARKEVAEGWGMPGLAWYFSRASIEWFYKETPNISCWYIDGSGIGDIYGPETFACRYDKSTQKKLLADYFKLTEYVMEKTDVTVLRSFDASYTVTDEIIAEYDKAIPRLTAMYTGYNGEPNGLNKNGNAYLIGDVAVFRCIVGSNLATYDPEIDGTVLVDRIRDASKSYNFINTFVLGNYCLNNSECLLFAQDELGSDYAIVRPDLMSNLLKQYLNKK